MTPEQKKEYMRQYRLDNKERITEQKKEYYKNNKEQIKEYDKKPNSVKRRSIRHWRQRGVIHEDFNKLYELYLNTTECMVCNATFKDTTDRCLDHCHTTGEYRNVLCRTCNNNDYWKKVIKPPE